MKKWGIHKWGILFFAAAMICSGCDMQKNGSSHDYELNSDGLRDFLSETAQRGIMLGHQDDLAYGNVWNDIPGASDVKFVCGDYPAVFGCDIGGYETGGKLSVDSLSFDKIRKCMVEAEKLGGISAVRWSASLPTVFSDKKADLVQLLPGGKTHAVFKSYLDSVASFFNSLKDEEGRTFSAIFQPFYCPNDSAHWWFEAEDSPQVFREVWKYTCVYLKKEKKVHNILFAFSMKAPVSAEMLMNYYPGDEYVDIVGFDYFYDPDVMTVEEYSAELKNSSCVVAGFATHRKKLSAITATGMQGIKNPHYFTQYVMSAIEDVPLSYILFWKNSSKTETYYHIPVKGHPSADDFVEFVKNPKILTVSDLAGENL